MNLERKDFMWLLLIILIFFFAFSQALKSWAKRKDAKIELLKKKWKTARKERKLWKDSHCSPWLNVFDDPEYQRLWEVEIGAEDLYLLAMEGISPGISWSDYRFERKKAEQENDNN